MPEIKIENKESAEEYIQQELTYLERSVDKCDISMIERVDSARSSMTYYLSEDIIYQPIYFEYNNQLNTIT